ncbi:MAG: hypothetical protein KA403_06995 [Candidatus Omnitrophica bacterium]|nr:hypothetical protein [Candidatus Omnitrophota bacterium]
MTKAQQIKLHKSAEKAMRSAVLKVVEEHKKSGVPLAVWQDGKVVRVKADKLRGL